MNKYTIILLVITHLLCIVFGCCAAEIYIRSIGEKESSNVSSNLSDENDYGGNDNILDGVPNGVTQPLEPKMTMGTEENQNDCIETETSATSLQETQSQEETIIIEPDASETEIDSDARETDGATEKDEDEFELGEEEL